MLFGYLGVLFLLSWEMTLASGVVLLLATRIPNVWIKKSAQVGRKLVDINTLLTEFLVGRLRSPRLVKLSGTEVAEKNEFNKLTQEQRKYSVYSSILLAKTDIAIEPFIVGLSLVFLYFSYTVLQLQVEAIGLYLVIILRLMPIIKSILSKWQSVQRSLGSIEAIEGRLKTMKASVEKDISDESLICLKHSLFFNNVTYRYPQEKSDALKNITIEFEINKMTAIVGPSGSGKSTLIDFFPRLRSPRSGAILVDGERVEKYTLKSLRELIAYAPQAPQIFDGTVRNHILYGKNSATDEEIVQAARLAGADKFIKKLQQGYDTVLGEDAVRLSGGQRQRLDLARALVKKAPILILDEPTSNLDVESEEIFKNVLSHIKKVTNTTIIIVTHRLESIVDANQIVILNHGVVEAIGKHAELLKQQGWYAKAWKIQNAQI
jgi:ABC-type multidrug transport system fused ATPase/permease subunit